MLCSFVPLHALLLLLLLPDLDKSEVKCTSKLSASPLQPDCLYSMLLPQLCCYCCHHLHRKLNRVPLEPAFLHRKPNTLVKHTTT
jgi:hypothetical protein